MNPSESSHQFYQFCLGVAAKNDCYLEYYEDGIYILKRRARIG